jgi:hypothetical protein
VEGRGAGGPDGDGAGRERAVFQYQLMPDLPGPTTAGTTAEGDR